MDTFAPGCNCLVIMRETMKVREGRKGAGKWPVQGEGGAGIEDAA
jgi:hypothetical protein